MLVAVEAVRTCLLEMVTVTLSFDRDRKGCRVGALLLTGCLVLLTHSLAGIGREVRKMLYRMKLLKSLVVFLRKMVGKHLVEFFCLVEENLVE